MLHESCFERRLLSVQQQGWAPQYGQAYQHLLPGQAAQQWSGHLGLQQQQHLSGAAYGSIPPTGERMHFFELAAFYVRPAQRCSVAAVMSVSSALAKSAKFYLYEHNVCHAKQG